MKPVLPAARVLLLVAGLFAAAACTRKSDTQTADALRLADREAIEATMHRYLRGLDHVDANLYASTFAPDGLLDINGDLREGRDAMKAIIEEEVALRQAMRDRGQPPRVLFHLETNTRIEFPEAGSALRTAY